MAKELSTIEKKIKTQQLLDKIFPPSFLDRLARTLTYSKSCEVVPREDDEKTGSIHYFIGGDWFIRDFHGKEAVTKKIENFYGKDKDKYLFMVNCHEEDGEVWVTITKNPAIL